MLTLEERMCFEIVKVARSHTNTHIFLWILVLSRCSLTGVHANPTSGSVWLELKAYTITTGNRTSSQIECIHIADSKKAFAASYLTCTDNTFDTC